MTPPTAAALWIPAKLNWDLRVLARREDGFHELRSWFLAVGRYDRLDRNAEASANSTRLEVVGSFAEGVPVDDRNLVLRAEDAWRAAGGEAGRCYWRLTKEIPHGAGLGGGSGDAAAALKLLQNCATRALSGDALQELALGLGSDVPYFLGGRGAELRGGRGEQQLGSAPAPADWVVVAVPPIVVSTPAVFGALRLADVAGARESASMPADRPGPNDLERAALQVAPALADFSAMLRQQAEFVMSGSGSSFFAAMPDEASATALADQLSVHCAVAFAAPVLGSAADTHAEGGLLWD